MPGLPVVSRWSPNVEDSTEGRCREGSPPCSSFPPPPPGSPLSPRPPARPPSSASLATAASGHAAPSSGVIHSVSVSHSGAQPTARPVPATPVPAHREPGDDRGRHAEPGDDRGRHAEPGDDRHTHAEPATSRGRGRATERATTAAGSVAATTEPLSGRSPASALQPPSAGGRRSAASWVDWSTSRPAESQPSRTSSAKPSWISWARNRSRSGPGPAGRGCRRSGRAWVPSR